MPPAEPSSRTFRLPRLAYLAVLFLIFCALPIAFAGAGDGSLRPAYTWRMIFLALPLLAAVFIARTATIVNRDGVRVRAAFGSRRLPWTNLRGLSVEDRAVYAVLSDGAVRLPCVGVSDLAAITRLSDGRLPEVAEPTPKYAPQRRRRR